SSWSFFCISRPALSASRRERRRLSMKSATAFLVVVSLAVAGGLGSAQTPPPEPPRRDKTTGSDPAADIEKQRMPPPTGNTPAKQAPDRTSAPQSTGAGAEEQTAKRGQGSVASARWAVERTINGWPAKPHDAALKLIDKYGPPQEMTESLLIWKKAGPWKR